MAENIVFLLQPQLTDLVKHAETKLGCKHGGTSPDGRITLKVEEECVAACAGAVAVVIDGAVRDSEAIRELGFPMYAAGLNPNGPTKFVPGRLNHPISIGGVTVNPGDLVVGDADGVTVIERAKAAAMLPLAQQKVAAETKRIAEIKSRKALAPAWLNGALCAAGVIKEGETL